MKVFIALSALWTVALGEKMDLFAAVQSKLGLQDSGLSYNLTSDITGTVTSFETLQCFGNLVVKSGDSASLTVTTQNVGGNIKPSATMSNGLLTLISTGTSDAQNQELLATLTLPSGSLQDLHVTTGGAQVDSAVFGANAYVNVGSADPVVVSAFGSTTTSVRIITSGSSQVNIEGVSSGDIEVNDSGSGAVFIQGLGAMASGNFIISGSGQTCILGDDAISFSGDLTFTESGTGYTLMQAPNEPQTATSKMKLLNSGTSPLQLCSVPVDSIDLSNMGTDALYVNPQTSISGRNSGTANLYITGNPSNSLTNMGTGQTFVDQTCQQMVCNGAITTVATIKVNGKIESSYSNGMYKCSEGGAAPSPPPSPSPASSLKIMGAPVAIAVALYALLV